MKKLLLFFFLIPFFQAKAQQEDAWIYLKDKPNKTTFLNNPLTMLSQRALDRRAKLNISLDSIDVPVDNSYYNQIKNTPNITVLAKSKWLNAIHILAEVGVINNLTSTFSFIDHIEFANKSLPTNVNLKSKYKVTTSNHLNKLNQTITSFNYGDADNQIKMLKGNYLHEQGFTGKGQVIAVIDGGFANVNTLAAFQRIRDNNQILGGYDFVNKSDDFYRIITNTEGKIINNHGTNVLSTIGAYIENTFVGTAPDASFYLFVTEDVTREVPLEESLWVAAAEKADSLGVDVINTSLGYTTFDNSNYNYTYQDMDGKTTFISRGAEIGASRGLLLVNAAGNSGNSDWKYIGAPADAPSVISVGAVNALEEIAAFSSFGPTSDGRIKPEILAQGRNVIAINHNTNLTYTTNGTSFSSPIIAGLVACLNQIEHPLLKSLNLPDHNLNQLLKQAIYQSADNFSSPTAQYGYGIPDFENAYNAYTSSLATIDDTLKPDFTIFPNPAKNFIEISSDTFILNDSTIQIFTILGKQLLEKLYLSTKKLDVSFLKSGIYILKISYKNQQKTLKLVIE
ncbi:S8 family serine peptidase [uncultured Polaribacter sp.]|uniref:S8 family serine peptidase n=1 Tax=uncultured Polaribacter sp. TaxID=174711 RepID=UPI002617F65E|nr:S8 family serine peptidase [uncultured Polaribacter sp.]